MRIFGLLRGKRILDTDRRPIGEKKMVELMGIEPTTS
jgi:hypothetical protein